MRNLEDNLRDAVHDLAGEAPPPLDLAAAARTRGRRIRRRRQATLAAVAAALIGVTVTPYAVLRERATPPPVTDVTPAPSPSPSPSRSPEPSPRIRMLSTFDADRPYRLLGGAVVVAMSRTEQNEVTEGDTHHVLLDRATGRYRELAGNYREVVPGPGELFAVHEGPDAETSVHVVTAGGEVRRRIPRQAVGDAPQWSPDGSRLLVPVSDGFLVADPDRSGDRTFQPEGECPDYCSYSWLPDGTEIAVPRRDPAWTRSEAQPDMARWLDIYSATTGKLVRSQEMTGRPIGTRGWAPDGRHVLTRTGGSTGTITLTDTSNGSSVAELSGSDAVYLADGRILTYDDTTVTLHDALGRPIEKAGLPTEFRGLTLFVSAGS
ncbi:WD40 repeat domain-containing protein [Actinoplanes sp. DH11]|uniref:WD40 repeat domain-containing protein n=1 Tax=Actinoplanes sp. DH11 TaxID=2857011 RepID=UPI001E285AEB|nr:WD40 repeat domain-containing protein [Actinoplanes sp. DH11]